MRLLITLGLTLASVQSANADWPHLRGPNYDGVATEIGLADAWLSGVVACGGDTHSVFADNATTNNPAMVVIIARSFLLTCKSCRSA